MSVTITLVAYHDDRRCEPVSVTAAMVGTAAAVFLRGRLGLPPGEYALRRCSDQEIVRGRPIGDVLQHGDEVEFVPAHPE